MQWADEFWHVVFLTTHSLGDGSEQKMPQIVEKVHNFLAPPVVVALKYATDALVELSDATGIEYI